MVDAFCARGVNVINDPKDAKGAVVIRSHGIKPGVQVELEKNSKIIDATCPFVKRAQTQANNLAKVCDQVIVVGTAGHPEVEAIVDYAKLGGAEVFVVDCASALPKTLRRVGVVSQTTQSNDVFNEIVSEIKKRAELVEVKNTICSATEQRQDEAEKLALKCDVMIVLGGKNSSNTRRLFEICDKRCKDSYYIEQPCEIQNIDFSQIGENVVVGITAGASTPYEQIDELERLIKLKYSL